MIRRIVVVVAMGMAVLACAPPDADPGALPGPSTTAPHESAPGSGPGGTVPSATVPEAAPPTTMPPTTVPSTTPTTAPVTTTPGGGQDTGRPNIIVFLTDDQTSDQMLALPSVRALIGDRGTRFANAIVPIPLCCPARASLLTGQYPHNHGVQSNKSALGGGFDGLDQTNTDARWLHEAGYRTGHVGKYMNGYNRSKTIPRGWDEWWATSQNPFLMYDYTLNHNGVEQHFGFEPADYKTDVLTRLATDFVETEAPKADPFYLQVWYTAPHVEEDSDSTGQSYDDQPPRPAPRHAGMYDTAAFPTDPSFNEADVADKPTAVQALAPFGKTRVANIADKFRTQLASLASVDEGIRGVIDAVAAAGELDNTVLVFASDNGNMHGEHRIAFGKGDAYEPSIRVPLLVAGPGFPAGATVTTPVMFPDVAPTVVRLAGAAAGLTMDGQPLQEAVAHPSGDRAVLIGSGLDTSPDTQFAGVRTARWMYAEYPATGDTELYDLANDPYELSNLARDPAHAADLRDVKALSTALRGCRGTACDVAVPASLR